MRLPCAVVGRDIPLGVLPLGTLNHFAKDLGIPLDLDEAAKVVLDGVVCQVDVGEVNGRVFLNNSSLGVYPAIVRLRDKYRADLERQMARRPVGRPDGAAPETLHGGPHRGRGGDDRAAHAAGSGGRTTSIGCRGSCRDAGVAGSRPAGSVRVNAERRPGLLRLAWEVFRKGAEQAKEMDLITVEEATIETRRRRLPVAMDGEVVPLAIATASYRIRPGALGVYVPAGTSACNPRAIGHFQPVNDPAFWRARSIASVPLDSIRT